LIDRPDRNRIIVEGTPLSTIRDFKADGQFSIDKH